MSGMQSLFGGMEEDCPTCGEQVGDHTIRRISECLDERAEGEDRPYHDVGPEGLLAQALDTLRGRFALGGDVLIADHITAKSAVLAGEAGPMLVRIPAVIHEFAIGTPLGSATVAKVLYMGDTEVIRKYGKLIRDTSNGAANAAERAMADPRWMPGR